MRWNHWFLTGLLSASGVVPLAMAQKAIPIQYPTHMDAIQVLTKLPMKEKGSFSVPCLKNGQEFNFTIRFQDRGYLELVTGNAKVAVSTLGVEGFRTQFYPNKQENKGPRMDHNLRGVLQKSFAWDDTLAAWSSYYQYSKPELSNRSLRGRVTSSNGVYHLYFNGFYLGSTAPESMEFQFRNADMLTGSMSDSPDAKNYTTLDVSPKFNAKIGFKRNSFPRERLVQVDGVPFFLPEEEPFGNVLDLSHSWTRFCNIRSEGNEFGGRWGGVWTGATASQNNPTRFQFRVPREEYDALYVLAATQKNIPDALNTFTVQFYRPGAGYPVEFQSPAVPQINQRGDGKYLEVDGKSLSLVKIPLDAGALKDFADLPYLEFELTKKVYDYQCYPDPFYYSRLGGGLPSGVKIFAMTLGKAPVKVEFSPDQFANVWNLPEQVSYTVKMENRSEKEKKLTLKLDTESWSKEETTSQSKVVKLAPGATETIAFRIPVKLFGHHSVNLSVSGDAVYEQKRAFAYLRPRAPKDLKFDYPGTLYGFWNWNGGHYTINGSNMMDVMGRCGMNASGFNPQENEGSRKWKIRNYFAGDIHPTHDLSKELEKKKEQSLKNQQAENKRNGKAADYVPPANPLDMPCLFGFGSEPYFGVYTAGSLPQYYGEEDLDPYATKEDKIVAGAKLSSNYGDAWERLRNGLKKNLAVLKQLHPDYKVMVPWGDPNFATPFLRDPELEPQIDGILYDTGLFDRLPEMQMHQTAIHRLWQFRQEWMRFSKRKPLMVSIEGPAFAGIVPGGPFDGKTQANLIVRSSLLLSAHGMTRQFAVNAASESTDYWGEQHYGGGLIGRYATLNPRESYSAVSTLTRHIGPTQFLRAETFPQKDVYCATFENVTDSPGTRLSVFWMVRGTRQVSFDQPVEVFDLMDNPMKKDMAGAYTISGSPVFVYGLPKEGMEKQVHFSEPYHTDSQNGQFVKLLSNPAKDQWTQVSEDDSDYTLMMPDFIRRFPAQMTVESVEIPSERGGKGLGITLPKQEKNRMIMPHFTTLRPKAKIEIPGTAKSLNFQVKGVADWGRIVLVLRDAAGKKWISVGAKNEWNCDDTQSRSVLNFEGWRLLKIDLPGNLPWDGFRLKGSASWSAVSGSSDTVVYPLALDKIMVERREQWIQVNDMVSIPPEPVILGDLFAEYENAEQMGKNAVRLANTVMPAPNGKYTEPNPVAEAAKRAEECKNPLPAPSIDRLEEPIKYNDGTHGLFHFALIPDATEYDLYIAKHPDGRGAILLGRNLKKSPSEVGGFKADTEFYAFLVARGKDRRISPPSKPFRFSMKKNFGNL